MRRSYFGLLCAVFLIGSLTCAQAGDLLVSSRETNSIKRYDGTTGVYKGDFVASGILTTPGDMVFGPDGNLYVSNSGKASVERFDGRTGAYLGTFVATNEYAAGQYLRFGPDGNLYVSSYWTNSIGKFNGTTGAFMSVFATVDRPMGLAFAPNGDLYVASNSTNYIKRFNGSTGSFVADLSSPWMPPTNSPAGMEFYPIAPYNSYLCVVSSGNYAVKAWDTTNDAYLGNAINDGVGGWGWRMDIAFNNAGQAFVTTANSAAVLMYNGGEFAGNFITAGSGGLGTPGGIVFMPDAVPEPSSMLALGTSLIGLSAFVSRRRKS